MVMKIENYEGTADTFTWPHNPQSFDDTTDSNHSITKIGYQRHHIAISGGGIDPKSIILSGHFDGVDRFADWRNMTKHFFQTTQIKKLYFETDKFHMGIGQQAKRTHTGGRTNFIDYVASFESFLPVLFGDTEKSSGTNGGNAKTFITEITGTITSGAADVVISDNVGNEITIAAAQLTTGHTFTYKLVKMVDSGSSIFVTEYAYVELNGTQTRSVQTTEGFGLIQLDPAENVTAITTTNITGATVKFRDGYYD